MQAPSGGVTSILSYHSKSLAVWNRIPSPTHVLALAVVILISMTQIIKVSKTRSARPRKARPAQSLLFLATPQPFEIHQLFARKQGSLVNGNRREGRKKKPPHLVRPFRPRCRARGPNHWTNTLSAGKENKKSVIRLIGDLKTGGGEAASLPTYGNRK